MINITFTIWFCHPGQCDSEISLWQELWELTHLSQALKFLLYIDNLLAKSLIK